MLVHVCAAASAGIKARRERVLNCIVNTEEENVMNESLFVSLCVVEGSGCLMLPPQKMFDTIDKVERLLLFFHLGEKRFFQRARSKLDTTILIQ